MTRMTAPQSQHRPPRLHASPVWRTGSDSLDRASWADDHGAYLQGSLALSYPLPASLDKEPTSSALTMVRPMHPDQADPLEDAPDATGWAGRFVQAVVEVISSDRPLHQLLRWTNETVYAEIGRRKDYVTGRRGPGPHPPAPRQQVATVHVTVSVVGTAEVAARIVAGRRSRALAARLDYVRGRWTCTAISFG